MSEVKRYAVCIGSLDQVPVMGKREREVVLASDYDDLLAERDALLVRLGDGCGLLNRWFDQPRPLTPNWMIIADDTEKFISTSAEPPKTNPLQKQ